MTPKPAYEQLFNLVRKEWWTCAEGRSNAQGLHTAKVFYGTHRLQFTLPDGRGVTRDIETRRGGESRFEIIL